MKKSKKEPETEISLEEFIEQNPGPELMRWLVEEAQLELMRMDNDSLRNFEVAFRNIAHEIKFHPSNFDKKLNNISLSADEEVNSVAPLLEAANLWFTPSMSVELIIQLKNLLNKNAIIAQDVEQIFIQYYGVDNWNNLRLMVASWKESDLFLSRMQIIEDAMEAHVNGKYTLSIPTLLPQVEGVLSSITGESAGHPNQMFKDTILNKYPDYFYYISKNILLRLATSPMLYGGITSEFFTPEKYPDWVIKKGQLEDRPLNRHAILHGIQINYSSKENSLRAFLLLDALYWIAYKNKK